MHGAIIIAIIFGSIVTALAVVGGTILMAIRLFRGTSPQRAPHAAAEETRIIQEVYRNLTRMEERVEALEIILHEKEKKG